MKKLPKSTKQSKHYKDNEKRKDSLENKFRQKMNEKQLIKNALAKLDTTNNSKKIIFNDDDDDDMSGVNMEVSQGGGTENGYTMRLFDGSDNGEDNEFEIKIKNHFEGKKGHKLLNLQSGYNNDERFKLDERFMEDDSDDEEMPERSEKSRDDSGGSEKAKQLEILGKVLGHPIQAASEKKEKKGLYEMVRFDASNEDHKRHDRKSENDKITPDGDERKKEKKKKKKEERGEVEKQEKAPVSKEKFYEVSDELRKALKDRKKSGNFSLLAAFSKRPPNEAEEEMEEEDEEDEEDEETEPHTTKVMDSDEEHGVGKKIESSTSKPEAVKVSGISREKFFFSQNDSRFEEGLSFINKKDSEEAKEAAENYEGTRKDVREVLRLRWQKHRQRQNPFKRKIGGSKWDRVRRTKMTPFSKGGRRFGRR